MNGSKHIVVEKLNGVLHLGINRPEKKNALTGDMYLTLSQELLDADKDPQVKSVLIYGTHDAFSAGNDLKGFDNREPGAKSPAQVFLITLHEFEKPIVAAVEGFAIGIGVTMLLHCDFVYAAPDASFRLPFVNLGVVPEASSSLLLPLNAGYKQAAQLLMLGDFFDTAKAVDAGVVTSVVPNEQLFDQAVDCAVQLAKKPSEALLLTKKLMKKSLNESVSDRIELEGRHFAKLLLSKESIAARESVKARTHKSSNH